MSQATPLPRGAEAGAALEPAATKERLLDAAEQLFGEHGFAGTSMRALTRAAGSSVSAVNYHFGSKEALLGAVVKRRLQPVNERRIEALDALEAARGPEAALRIEDLLDAFFRPAFDRLSQASAQGDGSMPRQVLARLYTDPPEVVQPLRAELFAEVNERFLAAYARIFPEAQPRELRMVQHLAVASLVHVLSGQLDAELTAELEAGATPGEPLHEPLLQTLIAHAAAGARAIAATAREGTRCR